LSAVTRISIMFLISTLVLFLSRPLDGRTHTPPAKRRSGHTSCARLARVVDDKQRAHAERNL